MTEPAAFFQHKDAVVLPVFLLLEGSRRRHGMLHLVQLPLPCFGVLMAGLPPLKYPEEIFWRWMDHR